MSEDAGPAEAIIRQAAERAYPVRDLELTKRIQAERDGAAGYHAAVRISDAVIDELEPDLSVLQGVDGAGARNLLAIGWHPWTDYVLCVDVLDLNRRHVCRSCERPLAPRRAYCSDKCRLVFEQDHFWGLARARALKRARIEGLILEPAPQPLTVDDILRGRGQKRQAELLLGRERLASLGDVSPRIRRYRGYRCALCGQLTEEPEVNHIKPVLGGHRSVTCLNHEENLEVLCHTCHLGATAQQLADRRRR